MQRYQVVVNGNTYSVTVKSIVGATAVVDVDGWEFHVAIDEESELGGSVATHINAAGPSPGDSKSAPAVAKSPTTKKRSSALEALGPRKTAAPEVSGKGVVSANLPGQIVEIIAKVGDEVKKGQLVCKMEAMKMVNEVVATVDGTIKEILVEEKQNVLENQPLMIID